MEILPTNNSILVIYETPYQLYVLNLLYMYTERIGNENRSFPVL
jgi:hypothetical protein